MALPGLDKQQGHYLVVTRSQPDNCRLPDPVGGVVVPRDRRIYLYTGPGRFPAWLGLAGGFSGPAVCINPAPNGGLNLYIYTGWAQKASSKAENRSGPVYMYILRPRRYMEGFDRRVRRRMGEFPQ